jgi:two-component system sensor kinase FixL
MNAQEYFPWCQKQLIAGQQILLSSIEEAPAEAARDRETWRHLGIKTSLTIPLIAGGGPTFGAVSFNDMKKERQWTEPLVKQFELIAQIFANALFRKRTEEEIFRIREEYTHIARVSAMGELTASLAHELKQPLAAIRSNAQAALRFITGDKPDIDELHEILKDIIIDNRRADDVIRKLRALMRKSDLHITELNMKELVEDILPLVASHEAMRKISLSVELDETIPLVVGDRIQIQQVILNLILNSTEALMKIKKPSRSIAVRTYQQDNLTVTLSVTDNGPGIEAGAMPHLFEAFYTTKPEGLGMGLAICRSIVEAHGGRLWAQNNLDGGAAFYFTIPIAREAFA